MAIDSRGLTEGLVSVATTGFKALRFDIDPRSALRLGNITDLGHPEVRRGIAWAENRCRSLIGILPKRYSYCQGEFEEISK